MSARRIGHQLSLNSQNVTVHARHTQLTLSNNAIVVHKGGIEFRSAAAFPTWTEMTMALGSAREHAKLHANGVVISCTGNKVSGYHVSVVFTSLPRGMQDFLNTAVAGRESRFS